MLEMNREDFNEAEEKIFNIEEETKFCESLDVIIRKEMERRAKHQIHLDRSNALLSIINERVGVIKLKQKSIIQDLDIIKQRAVHGLGSDSILNWPKKDNSGPLNPSNYSQAILAGKLHEISLMQNGGSKPKKRDKKSAAAKSKELDNYFSTIKDK